ncbi:hypothetical protein ASPFODRAFT_212771 [Aspergillus luchuensis CBS 106.47]|uniref:Uncharacterized protein n=1 Tax=Aspergillus luchuensis (strain CBS 106.47) TaxID=1137211 RepID=A0A1M3SZM8_ASPLC|nr:hypothetical protein ASPFODRAFT_212979 [Aspergillus luchuensis CBS 106.47]OJZ80388.1 hypothetical protein ASPFODRAFT_212771 [Aspergillus luchuensis CBS 106.47]
MAFARSQSHGGGLAFGAVVRCCPSALSFDQPAPVPEFAANNPYFVVPQPICDGTQAHANSLIPAKGDDADQTRLETLCRNTRLQRSNRALATTRNDPGDHAAMSRQALDLPFPLSALTDGMQHIPVREIRPGTPSRRDPPPGGTATGWQDPTPDELIH